MDPISAFALGHVAGKAVDHLYQLIKSSVIQQAWDRRARNFVEAFCGTVAEKGDSELVVEMLGQLETDETKQELLFDAYRRVAFSASKILGPRIIGLVMANIIGQDRQPTEEEEQLMSAAALLNDIELISARDDWGNGLSQSVERKVHSRYDRTTGGHHAVEYFVLPGAPGETGGYEYWLILGPWAGKLHSLGLTWTVDSVLMRNLESKKPNQNRVGAAITVDLHFSGSYPRLMKLITLAEQVGKQVP